MNNLTIAFIYIKNINSGIFEEQFVSLSLKKNYQYNKSTGEVHVQEANFNLFSEYYCNNVNNIIGVYGNNTVGKSTLLNALGRFKLNEYDVMKTMFDDCTILVGYEPIESNLDYEYALEFYTSRTDNKEVPFVIDEITTGIDGYSYKDGKFRKKSEFKFSFSKKYFYNDISHQFIYTSTLKPSLIKPNISKPFPDFKKNTQLNIFDIIYFNELKNIISEESLMFNRRLTLEFKVKDTSGLKELYGISCEIFILALISGVIDSRNLKVNENVEKEFFEFINNNNFQQLQELVYTSFFKYLNSFSKEDDKNLLKDVVNILLVNDINSNIVFDDYESFNSSIKTCNGNLTVSIQDIENDGVKIEEFTNIISKLENALSLDADANKISKSMVENIMFCFYELKFRLKNSSSGEQELFRTCLHSYNYYKECERNNIASAILLLDEPELHLSYIEQTNYISFLNDFFSKLNNVNWQIFFTTHSVITLSDLHPRGVIKIDVDSEGKREITSLGDINLFGKSIISIIRDEMKGEIIGKHALKCIEENDNLLLKSDSKILKFEKMMIDRRVKAND